MPQHTYRVVPPPPPRPPRLQALSEFQAVLDAQDKQAVPLKQQAALDYVGAVEEVGGGRWRRSSGLGQQSKLHLNEGGTVGVQPRMRQREGYPRVGALARRGHVHGDHNLATHPPTLPPTLPPSLPPTLPPSLPPTLPPSLHPSHPPSHPPSLPPFLPPSLPRLPLPTGHGQGLPL